MTTLKLMLALRNIARRLSLSNRFLLPQQLLRRCFRHARGVACVHDFDGDLTIDLSLSEHMQRRIFWIGYYNREIVALLKRIVRPGMVVIDAGANIGEIALVTAKLVGPTGLVLAFEPMNEIATKLERNISHNKLKQITVAKLGLSDAAGNAPIYRSCGQGDVHDEHHGLGSLYGSHGRDELIQNIELTTLDAFLQENPVPRLDLIKIDIEGAELACLKGAKQTLTRYRPLLIVEIQEQTSTLAGYRQIDILEYLQQLGYTFQTIGRQGVLSMLSPDNLSAYQNVLCTPTSRHAPTDVDIA